MKILLSIIAIASSIATIGGSDIKSFLIVIKTWWKKEPL